MFWLNPTRSYIQSKDYNDYPCDTCGRRILKDVDIIKVGKKVKGGRTKKNVQVWCRNRRTVMRVS